MNRQQQFNDLVLRVLHAHGPKSTSDLYRLVQESSPTLCDDREDCTRCKVSSEPLWKHDMRWAQQMLRAQNKVVLDADRRWRAV